MGKSKDNEFLGIDVGTATNQLKKRIMLDLLCKLKLNNCLKCGLEIIDAIDLSIDHIKPWRQVDPELFWDIDNIAFSHRKCNTADRPSRKIGPEGTSWCRKHKEFLPIGSFSIDRERWNGVASYCKECYPSKNYRYNSMNMNYPCQQCSHPMRKKCSRCGWELPMSEYMSMRRREGVEY